MRRAHGISCLWLGGSIPACYPLTPVAATNLRQGLQVQGVHLAGEEEQQGQVWWHSVRAALTNSMKQPNTGSTNCTSKAQI
jgi:hypothetical protein